MPELRMWANWVLRDYMIVSSSDRKPVLLIVDDDQSYQLALRMFFKSDFEVKSAYNSDEAMAIVKNHHIDLIILDVQMRSSDEGLKSIPKIRDINDDVSIVISSGLTDFATVREATRLGALDYISKDLGPDELLHSVRRVLEKRSLLKRQSQQTYEVKSEQKKHKLVGKSAQIDQLRRFIDKIRQSKANTVIFGETGTGKEVVARLLRSDLEDGSMAPFVAVDSATIHSQTAESILFGHEKGAFTGADKPRKGIFEEANGGIVYFDELANMPLDIQSKLLRVIQEKEVTRLGSTRSIPLDFRVIAATNKDLESMVKNGLFKEDLYQRLNVIPIALPPLRERREDIPELIEHFVGMYSNNDRWIYFTDAALKTLQDYSWPGNIRELQNLVSYLFAVSEIEEIDLCDLPPKFRDPISSQSRMNFTIPVLSAEKETSRNFYDRVSEFESALLKEEFSKSDGNISRLAEALGMDRSHLYSKLKTYQIHSPANKLKTRSS